MDTNMKIFFAVAALFLSVATPVWPSTNGHPPVQVSLTLKNSGKKAGAEVVQVYVQDRHSKVARPEKELKGFEKVSLLPDEEKQVTISLDERAFSYFDEISNRWKLEPGAFTILVNSSASQNRLKGTIDVESSQ